MIADYQYVKYSAYHYLYQLMDILFQEDSVKIDKHLIVVAGLGLTAAVYHYTGILNYFSSGQNLDGFFTTCYNQ